ncbi:hypothetical protein P171DRAFT_479419 [Karstenula rhodostoma CBS 690.94]|uniref:F-box domain-containing protein n=1 Tax=Karstenula rhodostoma CBS 690.94 TaxID=1392251 RepID=A0A9P4UI67_9PLEO|nr:hypothetical protein P171DRAFT_479419 [Karstenula rhodostoma CBS 690.94]
MSTSRYIGIIPNPRADEIARRKREHEKKLEERNQARNALDKRIWPRCRLKELPAELRNRIYDFAQETVAIPTTLSKTPASGDGGPPSSYQFLALMQTCALIREEYRPIWLRDLVVRLKLGEVQMFINDFYEGEFGYDLVPWKAPKTIFISWDHNGPYGKGLLFDLTPLLKLQNSRPDFIAEFACRQLVDQDFDNDYDYPCCRQCGESLLYFPGDMSCAHDHEEAVNQNLWYLNQKYYYLEAINNFFANSHENWLTLRGRLYDTTKVQALLLVDHERPTRAPGRLTIHLRLSKYASDRTPFSKFDMFNSRVQLLESLGIQELEGLTTVDFVLAEETGISTIDYAEQIHAHPVYNQVLIPGEDMEEFPDWGDVN